MNKNNLMKSSIILSLMLFMIFFSAISVWATASIPVISSISPASGTISGGTQVTITGTGFTGATGVSFGSTTGAALTIISDTSITATSPAGNGTVDVTVTGAGGTSATSTSDQFTYVAPTVLALGDSIAFGMSATQGNGYVDLLYNHLLTLPANSDLSLNNLSVPGDTSSVFLARLQTEPYKAAVGNAKVITLSIGGDNLLSPVIGAVCTAFGVNPVNNPNLLSELAAAMATNPNKNAILASIANSPDLAQALQSGVSQLGADFPIIIGTLKTLAPQAQIYILNLYNPFNVQDPLFTVFDPLIRSINQVLKDYAFFGYKVTDVYTKFRMSSNAVNFNLTTIQLDPHPTTFGHAAIFQTILDAESGLIPATYYAVNIGTLTGGSIIVNSPSATAGSTITLTINPENDLQLKAGTLKYNDGTADHPIDGTSFNMPTANVTVTAAFEQIPAGTLQSISITKPAAKLTYTVGDNLDLDGLEVTGTYSSVGTKVETVSATNVTGFNSSVAVASQTLTITIGGKTTSYNVVIEAPPIVTSLTYQTATIDSANKIVTLTFSDIIMNNTANLDELKNAITFASDGLTFNALSESDTVELIDKTLVITLATALSGNTNKFKINEYSLKDLNNKALEVAVTTDPINAFDECFIATAAFGSKNQTDVVLLRHFRDQFLLTNPMGKFFVQNYYHYSPPIAQFIAGNVIFKFVTRVLLLPFVVIVYLLFHPVLLVSIIAVIAFLIVQRCRRRVVLGSR